MWRHLRKDDCTIVNVANTAGGRCSLVSEPGQARVARAARGWGPLAVAGGGIATPSYLEKTPNQGEKVIKKEQCNDVCV